MGYLYRATLKWIGIGSSNKFSSCNLEQSPIFWQICLLPDPILNFKPSHVLVILTKIAGIIRIRTTYFKSGENSCDMSASNDILNHG